MIRSIKSLLSVFYLGISSNNARSARLSAKRIAAMPNSEVEEQLRSYGADPDKPLPDEIVMHLKPTSAARVLGLTIRPTMSISARRNYFLRFWRTATVETRWLFRKKEDHYHLVIPLYSPYRLHVNIHRKALYSLISLLVIIPLTYFVAARFSKVSEKIAEPVIKTPTEASHNFEWRVMKDQNPSPTLAPNVVVDEPKPPKNDLVVVAVNKSSKGGERGRGCGDCDFQAIAYYLKLSNDDRSGDKPFEGIPDFAALPKGTLVNIRSGLHKGTYVIVDRQGKIMGDGTENFRVAYDAALDLMSNPVKLDIIGHTTNVKGDGHGNSVRPEKEESEQVARP